MLYLSIWPKIWGRRMTGSKSRVCSVWPDVLMEVARVATSCLRVQSLIHRPVWSVYTEPGDIGISYTILVVHSVNFLQCLVLHLSFPRPRLQEPRTSAAALFFQSFDDTKFLARYPDKVSRKLHEVFEIIAEGTSCTSDTSITLSAKEYEFLDWGLHRL